MQIKGALFLVVIILVSLLYLSFEKELSQCTSGVNNQSGEIIRVCKNNETLPFFGNSQFTRPFPTFTTTSDMAIILFARIAIVLLLASGLWIAIDYWARKDHKDNKSS